ncbi:hypothetical protein BRC88_05480 [Halobacteriales archaeon QS_4_69_225]|nr:MAG: hypothetical protein BRC88_05480 [Halobacteriales archaeon QS_4_69_225]
MPSRRSYLAGAGSMIAAAAGCTSGRDETPDGDVTPTGDRKTPTDDGETPTPSPDGVELADIGARKAVTYESTLGSGGVLAAEGRQYVVASVVTGVETTAAAFALAAGGETYDPGLPDTAGGLNRSVAGRSGQPLGGEFNPGSTAVLAFVVPSPLSAPAAEIRYDGEAGPWLLGESARRTLAAPEPRYELASFEAPETVDQGRSLSTSVTVRNVSDTDGRFLAALYWPTGLIADDDESHLLERSVAAGETATLERSIDTRYTTSEDGPVSLRLRGHVAAERTVRVTGAETPS